MADLKVESLDLFVPPLEDLRSALEHGLAENFVNVAVDIVDCPDLSQEPFHLAAPGFGGSKSLVDLGGVPYLVPTAKREKVYDLTHLPALMNLTSDGVDGGSIAMIGAGAGPFTHLDTNCEMMTNLTVGKSGDVVINGSRLASINTTGQRHLHMVPQEETRCALLNNLLVTDGKPGTPVLRVHCSIRKGSDNFVGCMRKAIRQSFTGRFIGIGGVFLMEQGKARLHVMPDFSPCPLLSDDDVNNWLHFYHATAPLINLSVFVSDDPGLDLRVEHTHCFSTHGDGGHYHEDVTPESVVYRGYFTPAERIFRIDRPTSTHNVGRD